MLLSPVYSRSRKGPEIGRIARNESPEGGKPIPKPRIIKRAVAGPRSVQCSVFEEDPADFSERRGPKILCLVCTVAGKKSLFFFLGRKEVPSSTRVLVRARGWKPPRIGAALDPKRRSSSHRASWRSCRPASQSRPVALICLLLPPRPRPRGSSGDGFHPHSSSR